MYRIYLIFIGLLLSATVYAQNTFDLLSENRERIDDGNYQEALGVLSDSKLKKEALSNDSCFVLYNYEMGICLYALHKYPDAIPFFKSGLEKMDVIPHDDCVYMEFLYGIGICYKSQKDYRMAERYLRKAMILADYESSCFVTAQALEELADVYMNLGEKDMADMVNEQLAKKIQSDTYIDTETKLDELVLLIEGYEKQGKYNEAIKTFDNILSIIESEKGKNNSEYLSFANYKGWKAGFTYGMKEQAIEAFQKVIEAGRQFNDFNEYVSSAYLNLLRALAENGEYEKVISLIPEAKNYYEHTEKKYSQITTLEESVGNWFFDSGFEEYGVEFLEKQGNATAIHSLGNLANYYYTRNQQKSISYFLQIENQFDKISGITDETKIATWESLMYLYIRVDEDANAIKYGEMCLGLIENSRSESDYANHLINIATCYCRLQKKDEAYEKLNNAKELFEKVTAETQVNILSSEGYIKLMFKDYEEAVHCLEKTISFTTEKLGSEYEILTTVYHNLGRTYMLQGDYQKALENLYISKSLRLKLKGDVFERTNNYIIECEKKL